MLLKGSKSSILLASFCCLALMTLPLTSALTAVAADTIKAETYTVGPGDTLQVVVFGDENVSNILSGRFRIEPDGSIHYPLLGSVPVTGRSTLEIAKMLHTELAHQVQVLPPTVAVAEFAPVFLLGDVNRTGPYQYQPDMTVFELMLLAGGVSDPSDPASARMAVEQQASILQLQNFSLKIKRARLIAETTGEQFLPDSLKSSSDAASLVEVEASLFEVHTAASESRRTIYDAQKAGYDQEITSITQSITLHDEEVRLLEEQLESQQALTERGLAALSALRELKRQLTGTRREALEFRTALFRARQNRIGVDQAQAEAEAQTLSDAFEQLRDVEAALSQNEIELSATKSRLEQFSVNSNAAENALGRVPHFTLISLVDGHYAERSVDELTLLTRGDIVKVSFETRRTTTDTAAAAGVQ